MMSDTTAQVQKRSAALKSIVAAFGLTAMKVVVGVATNSLGILAEAAHSALDLAAAAVTYFAVRVSDKPADADHLFGHGKVENASALFEAILLLATTAWILREAYQRLMVHSVEVDPTIWAFLVMGISIVVDVTRSRMLYRTAREHNSQALEADALHFSTDVWSSSVVILGLAAVLVARANPEVAWLGRADAVAAAIVAIIVAFVSGELGWRALKALLDTAPRGMAETVRKEVESIDGVLDCHRVRIRPSGPRFFIDFHVTLDGRHSLDAAHALVEVVENRVEGLVPGSDVTVHADPGRSPSGAETLPGHGVGESKPV